jgi:hypothetical protein
MNKFFNGLAGNSPVGQNQTGAWGKTKQFFGNMGDRDNNGVATGWEKLRTAIGFLSPAGIANNLARGAYNQYRDYHPKPVSQAPDSASQFYGGQAPPLGAGLWQGYQNPSLNYTMPSASQPQISGDLYNNYRPQMGGDTQYSGGSATFNERTGTYAAQPQNGFLSGFNPSANQYRGMQMNQARDDYAASPFGQMAPGDRALANHTAHTNKMDALRWSGDMNPVQAQAEYNDQNAARFKASQYYK